MSTSIYRGLTDGMDRASGWQRPLGPLRVCWTEAEMDMWRRGEGDPSSRSTTSWMRSAIHDGDCT